MFSCKFATFFQNTFSSENLQRAASRCLTLRCKVQLNVNKESFIIQGLDRMKKKTNWYWNQEDMFPQKNMIFDWTWSYSSDCCCCCRFCFCFVFFWGGRGFKKGKKSRPIQNRHYNRQSVPVYSTRESFICTFLLEKYPGGVLWKIYTENFCKIDKKSSVSKSLFI